MAVIEWDVAAFRGANVVGRSGSVMELHTDGGLPAETVLRSFAVAVGDANDELASQEAAGRELYGMVSAVVHGPRGPVATFAECEPLAALRLYLATLASSLERQGVSGRLVPLPPAEIDRWYGNNSFGALTLALQLDLDRAALMATTDAYGKPQQRWWVPADTGSAALGPLIDWVLEAGPRIDLAIGFTSTPVERHDVHDQVRRGLAATGRVYLQVNAGPARMRRLVTSPYGDVLVHDFDPAAEPSARLERMVALLADVGPHLRAGWIQEGATSVDDRHMLLALVEPVHPLALRTATSPWLLLALEDEHVYDARVAQVLTAAQCARLPELDSSRWTTRSLDGGRVLVVHTSPEAWIDREPSFDPLPAPPRHTDPIVGCPVPDDVLAEARADLSAAILRPEQLEGRTDGRRSVASECRRVAAPLLGRRHRWSVGVTGPVT